MTSSLVHTPFDTSNNQVKQCTKEVETSSIGKGEEQTPRSLCSSLGDSENNVGSTQGLPLVDKNPLVLEKDHTQTNFSLPSSTEQVMEPSRTAETAMKSLE